ncbi:WhiB family transcriptional regulator [Allobranchiibius sp. GilTou73]|uniref:WhiB family transcriptional regulator n=1 Tax=Allobranchiibius sp. GilTou73 TaxID=2904523 RepID=UPI001F3B95E4|nr:WhiB family transcriptional regulator [Allobranchiibius sp. GilTou73]UIJ34499.1 WhiB family transcriptional regulator [Allobranchiibius sp. GilTou73]
MAERGQRPICSTDPPRWLSDDAAQREAAARDCKTCPLLLACRAAGEDERAGVWGGIDRGATRTRKSTVSVDLLIQPAQTPL